MSPVCPGQSIKRPLKVEWPGCPRVHRAQAESQEQRGKRKGASITRDVGEKTNEVAAQPLRLELMMGNKAAVLTLMLHQTVNLSFAHEYCPKFRQQKVTHNLQLKNNFNSKSKQLQALNYLS